MRLLISLLVFTLVRPTALALVPTRMARHPKRVCSPQQPQAGSIEMAGWMCKSKNGNGNCNSDEDDDIADMLYTMKITSEEIKGTITILKEHIENNENKRINAMIASKTNAPAFLVLKESTSCMRNTSSGDTYHVLNKGKKAKSTDINIPNKSPMIMGCTLTEMYTSKGSKSCKNKGNNC